MAYSDHYPCPPLEYDCAIQHLYCGHLPFLPSTVHVCVTSSGCRVGGHCSTGYHTSLGALQMSTRLGGVHTAVVVFTFIFLVVDV
jgi:hypothetical protein